MTKTELTTKLATLGFAHNPSKDYDGNEVWVGNDLALAIPESTDRVTNYQIWDSEGNFLIDEFGSAERLINYLEEDTDVTAKMMENCLETILTDCEFGEIENVEIESVETFEAAGVMTTSNGLVLHLSNGSVFQLTIEKAV